MIGRRSRNAAAPGRISSSAFFFSPARARVAGDAAASQRRTLRLSRYAARRGGCAPSLREPALARARALRAGLEARQLREPRRRRRVLPRRERQDEPSRRASRHARRVLRSDAHAERRPASAVRVPRALHVALARARDRSRRAAGRALRSLRQMDHGNGPPRAHFRAARGLHEQSGVDVRPHAAAHRREGPGRASRICSPTRSTSRRRPAATAARRSR